MRRIDIAYKTKVAWNQIPSNFAFLWHIDPMHRLGVSMHARQIRCGTIFVQIRQSCDKYYSAKQDAYVRHESRALTTKLPLYDAV